MEQLVDFLSSLKFSTPFYYWIVMGSLLLILFIPWTIKKRHLLLDLHYLKGKIHFKNSRLLMSSTVVAVVSILLIGILTNPQIISKHTNYIYGYPVMLVVDVSGSMGVDTAEKTGYEESLEAFNDLISRRGDINYGLLIFSAENYIARYFINKNELFIDTLENKEDMVAISQGTRATDALMKARQFLTDNIEGSEKAIVLISDLNVSGQARLDLIKEMARISFSGINLYVIATGKEEERIADIPQISRLEIIDMYDKTGIDKICEDISSIQKSAIREESYSLETDMPDIFIVPSLVLISLYLFLSESRYLKIP